MTYSETLEKEILKKISVAENGFFISSNLSLEELGKILNDKMNEFIEED